MALLAYDLVLGSRHDLLLLLVVSVKGPVEVAEDS